MDYLMTYLFVGEERVCLLGICAGGGYTINAALTEHRVKAIRAVGVYDIGRVFRQMLPMEELFRELGEVGKQ
jgi:uncharacterized protein